MAGNFNDISSSSEKQGGKSPSLAKCLNFTNNISNCNLLDLGFKGSPFTWSNNRFSNKHTLIRERLDRFLCNDLWLQLFPNSYVFHLSSCASDHKPILPKTTPPRRSTIPFKFESMWLHDPSFPALVATTWGSTDNYTNNMSSFLLKVKSRNKTQFGDLFYRKKKILARLNGISRSLSLHHSSFLLNLQKELTMEYFRILRSEEDFWKMKSRISWIQDGDHNTSFFHKSTLNRRRKNRIIGLKNNNNVWLFDPVQISTFIIDHFAKIYTTDHSFSYLRRALFPVPHPHLSEIDKATLQAPCIIHEISKVVFSFSPLKAPGPDGLHPLFFQKYWDITKSSVYSIILNIMETAIAPPDLNQTYIALIPNKDNVDTISQYRPISLCNTVYKILTKVMANRIKPFLDSIISPMRAAFLPQRRTSDNIIIAQEVIKFMRTIKSKNSYFILKMDMEKSI